MEVKVVVTGIGVISPVGIGKENYWSSLISGKSGISEITHFDASGYPCRIGGEAENFNSEDYVSAKDARRMDRFIHFAVGATRLALEDANLEISPQLADRVGVIVGSGIGGLQTLETQHEVLLDKGPTRVSPFLVPMMICNLAAGQVSIVTGAKGPNLCTVTACASATHAIGEALEIMKRGEADICIAGGAEAPLTPLGLAGFSSMKALSKRNDEPTKASRPFDKDRDGFVMGEGAGIVILETLESAKKRDGAHIYCELVGYGMTGDAYHITAPDPEGDGAARAMELAVRKAGISNDEVNYINAHGTSTLYNDEFETMAIKKVFKDHAYKLIVSSTKSMTGHLLGAAGGIEFIACALAIERAVIPPTINLDNPDPECDLNYAPNRAVEQEVNVALSNSLGFGGHNAVVAAKKFTD